MRKNITFKIVVLAMLVAMNVVLSRFVSINAWNLKIGFTFVTVFIAAYLFGPLASALVAGLGDFAGAIMFPIGPYFPGFTFSAILSGLLFGLLLKHNTRTVNVVVCSLIHNLVIGLLINTYWIFVLYNKPSFWLVMSTRVLQSVVLIAVEVFTIKLLGRVLPKLIRSVNE